MYRVITVDDEPMIKKTLRHLIDRTGQFQVVGEGEDGREALALIERHDPDLVITDIRMPVMDGLELIEELRRQGRKPEVVILSGYDDFSYAQKAIRYGIVEYLLKPIRPALLLDTLDRLMRRFEQSRQSDSARARTIMLCKKYAEMIAEHVWLLDESGVSAELKRFEDNAGETNADPEGMRTAYVELLGLLHGLLAEKGSGLFPEGETNYLPAKPEELYPYASRLAEEAMERIRQSRNFGSHQGIHRAADYLKRHFTSASLSLQEVAGHISMSPAYFSRSFKEEMGVTFVHYLTQLRMDKAKELLGNPDCKTADIAEAVGYADYVHFAKVFKKYGGLTPTEYRKRLGVM